ncbi:MAG TPA: hypothetical protein VMA98_03420 [Candidatus Acidoferrales bacterium]|nr:hypothetical protein [Candidatus Acidoferrales bacterium]
MVTQPSAPVVVAATSLEARAVRRRAPRANVVEAGVSLARLNGTPLGAVAISCGLAGGLRNDLPTGALVIPSVLATTAGDATACDPEWTERLREAARRLGYAFVDAPLLSSTQLVTGGDRPFWAERGYAGVDMESAFIRAPAIAAVRVILDTPQRELSADWLHPARAMLRPRNWGQMVWLAREGPRCADRAARVIAAAL